MQKVSFVIILICTAFLPLSLISQTLNEPILFGIEHNISEGYSIRMSSGYTPFGENSDLFLGRISVGVNGIMEGSLLKESAIGNPINQIKPVGQLNLRLQILPQKGNYPSVSLFLTSILDKQGERIYGDKISTELPDLFNRGVNYISYKAKTTIAGLQAKSNLSKYLSVNATLGVREVIWNQEWSKYSIDMGYPVNLDGYQSPLKENSVFRINWSAGISINPITGLFILADVSTFPFIHINENNLLIEYKQGQKGIAAIYYQLPGVPFGVSIFDQLYSSIGASKAYNQMGVGVSFGISI